MDSGAPGLSPACALSPWLPGSAAAGRRHRRTLSLLHAAVHGNGWRVMEEAICS